MDARNASADILNSRQRDRNAAAWLDRMRLRLDPAEAGVPPPPPLQAAAVLAPLVLRDGALHVILTVRPDTMPRHPGQISFPGGRLNPGEGADIAALRETQEEIGLPPDRIEMLGRWDDVDTVGGFRVTPFAGLVDPGAIPRADPREVAEMFTAPLDFLLDPANHRWESRAWEGGVRRFYAISFGDYYIWGATAAMLRALSTRLGA